MLKKMAQDFLHSFGYEIRRYPVSFDAAMETDFRTYAKKLNGLHAQSLERLYSLYKAVLHIETHNIPGAIVECGVYKGASPMMAAYVLNGLKSFERKIYLYDTFEGMTPAGENDIELATGKKARDIFRLIGLKDWKDWSAATLDEVRENTELTSYPKENFIFIKGKVQETLPAQAPEKIALLRLDTDWYESTYHELTHLFPRLSVGGVLILDDYGHWKGAKDAVDQYFKETKHKIFLQRIDYTGYCGIKTEPS
jgi:O-methyltransferase